MNALATALITMRRTPYQTLAAILITMITFLVGYSFSLFSYTAQGVLSYFETQPQVIAFFALDTTAEQIQTVQNQMQAKDYVTKVTVVSKEQALELYRQDNQNDPLLLELVTADILPASIEVSGNDITALNQIKTDLDGAAQVEEVVLQQDIITSLERWTKTIRWIGISSMIVLGATAFLVIMIVTGMKVSAKRRSIQIMNVLGASHWFIKGPFLYEGFLYGILGSIFGWGVMFVLFLYLTPWIKDFIGAVPVLPIPWEVFVYQAGIGTLAGIVLGGLASSVAVGRMMRR